ncbi:mechanosensitive ion channel [Aquimarina sp. MMG015]|uniref:mechanosensitive ion channel family protein n=1 Tax=Aquimarina TaxID=290174 RepID=UPI00040C1FFC|nr:MULTISPECIES: mechanosensitive ion channel domain-containing protein [Aquimarina]AXT56167.1 mechanosensitive ion channel protein MscS [Aquimarina sp. AD1]MBQ4803736.1 mechanosensitive ion channel [Aquimarina sp. MMG015]RKN28738.1 mechanosensitive ion channel protein MscS [Aquimarina sp. AD1]
MIQEEITEQVKEVIQEDVWGNIKKFLDYEIFHFGPDDHSIILTVGLLLFVIFILIITTISLKFIRRIVTRKLQKEDKLKFESVFSFSKYFIYIIVILIALDSIGFNITAIFAASAALLVGVGLALQTLIQDVISGIFILIDQTVHVGDIIELDGKVGRVEEIKLRTTRAVTIDNKVLVIPNHKYLTSTLYNWTQNGSITRESIEIGVAYGSDINLVKQLLIKIANDNDKILKTPEPLVLFTNFGDSSLNFKLIFTMNDSFQASIPKSEIRFEIDRLFRENKINIPFPQREVTILNPKQ